MKKKVLIFCYLIGLVKIANAQGNHVFSGGEAANFGIVDLATPGGQTWSTARAALPGYFSAVNGATYTGSSDAANVNGYVKKYGNEVFIFPVGSGTDLRNLRISAPGSTTDAYATAWIVGDPTGNLDPTTPNAGPHPISSKTAPIISVSPVGQWDWQVGNGGNLGTGTTGTGAGLTITVSIPDMSTFALAANLRLVGWNGTSWVDLSGGATASGNTENSTLSGTMIAGITAIGIGSTAFVLPLDLSEFNVTQKECGAALVWKTSSENNTDYFEIQVSTDAINFTTVATKPSTNNNNGGSYTFYTSPRQGIATYYRLRMVDRDGRFTYSPVRIITISCGSTREYIAVFPNPVTTGSGTLTISFGTAYRGKAMLLCTNTIGQQLVNQPLIISQQTNAAYINTGILATGAYYVTIYDEKGNQLAPAQKIIKQ